MSILVLVRHGQASFMSENYDRLSDLGEVQSRRLGEYWVRYGVAFDEVFTGTLERQTRTEEIVGEVYRKAGLLWPEARPLAGFNEYDANTAVNTHIDRIYELHPSVRDLIDTFKATRDGPDRDRNFQRMFEAVMKLWVADELPLDGVETWVMFRDRVREALAEATRPEPGGRRVAVFTSGGPIGAVTQKCLQAPEPMAVELNWRVRNGSLTAFVFSGGRMTMNCFNSYPHLEDPDHWTYR